MNLWYVLEWWKVGGRVYVNVLFCMTFFFFVLHANRLSNTNTKTPKEQDIAKMNAVQWQNPDSQYWRMWFCMSHVSTSYTVRLGCAADSDPRRWTSRVVWKPKPEWKLQAEQCICYSGFRKPCNRQKKVFSLQFNELQLVWGERQMVLFKLFVGFVCVSEAVLFDVYTLRYMFTLMNDFTVLDVLLLWRTGQGLRLDGQNACQEQVVF